jgi:hypothetical protein
MNQLSLLGAGFCGPTMAPAVKGEALDFVLGSIPNVGHAPGTSRASLHRPVATLYERDRETPNTWRRINGSNREPYRRIAQSHGDAAWMLDFLHYSADGHSGYENAMTKPIVERFADSLRPGLRACGISITSKKTDQSRPARALLSSLDPLVLALCWEPAVSAGCLLAGLGVKPLSDEWTVKLDVAMAAGLPWCERLAELSARHGPLVRAWRWLHAREASAGNRTASG